LIKRTLEINECSFRGLCRDKKREREENRSTKVEKFKGMGRRGDVDEKKDPKNRAKKKQITERAWSSDRPRKGGPGELDPISLKPKWKKKGPRKKRPPGLVEERAYSIKVS